MLNLLVRRYWLLLQNITWRKKLEQELNICCCMAQVSQTLLDLLDLVEGYQISFAKKLGVSSLKTNLSSQHKDIQEVSLPAYCNRQHV